MSKNIIITGALGSAISSAFLEQGNCMVHSSYINKLELEHLPDNLKNNPEFKTTAVDLLDENAVAKWFKSINSVDVLINVAGGFAMGKFSETTLANWQKMFHLNVDTCFLTSREALRRMDGSEYGRIINVGSFAATRGVAGMTSYTASKAAVIKLTEDLAEETLASKITVNSVLPTTMDTPANRAAMPDADTTQWVPVANVAHTVLFLAAIESWHITGACIPLRGHL